MISVENGMELYYTGFFHAHRRGITPKQMPDSILCFEILTGGGVYVTHNGGRRLYKRGTVFTHGPGDFTVNDIWEEDPYQCMVLRFYNKNGFKTKYPRIRFWNDLDYLDHFVNEGLKSYHDDACDRDRLGLWLWSTVQWQSSIPYHHEPEYPSPIARALRRIDRDPGRVLSVQQLADKCGVSVPYFQNLFRSHLGITPHQYLVNEKMKKARMLLAGSDEPIKNISADCGFANIETFYRAFNRNAGMTPGDFRRRNSPSYRLEPKE